MHTPVAQCIPIALLVISFDAKHFIKRVHIVTIYFCVLNESLSVLHLL